MKLIRMAGLVLLAGFGLSVDAAHAAAEHPQSKASNASTSSQVPAQDKEAAGLMDYHRHHHHGGVVEFVTLSLDTLGVDDAKHSQIEQVQSDLNRQFAPARQADKELLLTLADGIAAGSVDSVKVEAAIAKVSAASDAAHQASIDTLNKLHAILSPAERAALADKVQAHWAVWREVNHAEVPGGQQHGGRLAELTEELGLSPDQVSKISAAFPTALGKRPSHLDPKQGDAHVNHLATAFAAATFDAKSALPTNIHLASHGAERMALFYETAAPVLTPEQRTKLAEELHEYETDEPVIAGK